MQNLFAGLLLTALFCACPGRDEPGTRDERKTVTVEARDIAERVSAAGAIKPLREIRVKSKASGRVRKVHVQSGELVKAGQVLIELDPAEEQVRLDQANARLATARAALKQGEVELADARRLLSKQRNLRDDGLIPEETLLDAQSALKKVEANLERARAEVIQAEAQAAEAQIRFDETTVTAPIAGTVLDRFVEEGQIIMSGIGIVGGGTDLILLADMSGLRVVADLDEVDVAHVQTGAHAQVRVDAYPDADWQGTLTAISSRGRMVNNLTVFGVEILIEGEPDPRLKPEMSAVADILVRERKSVPTLPWTALHQGAEGWFVRVEDGEKTNDIDVRTGLDDGRFVEIAEGLEPGDEVLLFHMTEEERQKLIEEKRKRWTSRF